METKVENTQKKQYNRLWPLYGNGLENFGVNNAPAVQPLPALSPGELLVRNDACGLCFSDIKVINQGQSHPRIIHDMQSQPVVLGHEVCFTVVDTADGINPKYNIGDRLTLQSDIVVGGVGKAFGYVYQGGLSQFNLISQEIINSDNGDMLIPLPEGMGYAEAALIEPWACVEAAYRLNYRNHIKPKGNLWIIGGKQSTYVDFTRAIAQNTPANIFYSHIPDRQRNALSKLAEQQEIQLIPIKEITEIEDGFIDDIILLAPDRRMIEESCSKLAYGGIMAISDMPLLERQPRIDVGRIHYQRWSFISGQSPDLAQLYAESAFSSELKPAGTAWFAGAGGPFGRIHVQRTIQLETPPSLIVCTEIDHFRLEKLKQDFSVEAQRKGIDFVCLNPHDLILDKPKLQSYQQQGFDNVILLALDLDLATECTQSLASNGVLNLFAGIKRGSKTSLDFSGLTSKHTHFIGHSGSKIEDMRSVIQRWRKGQIDINRAVAAVGSLEAAKDGYQAMIDKTFPGKVVIYPNIKPFPLTGLPELKHILPSVYDKLSPMGSWSNAAEAEFLHILQNKEDIG